MLCEGGGGHFSVRGGGERGKSDRVPRFCVGVVVGRSPKAGDWWASYTQSAPVQPAGRVDSLSFLSTCCCRKARCL